MRNSSLFGTVFYLAIIVISKELFVVDEEALILLVFIGIVVYVYTNFKTQIQGIFTTQADQDRADFAIVQRLSKTGILMEKQAHYNQDILKKVLENRSLRLVSLAQVAAARKNAIKLASEKGASESAVSEVHDREVKLVTDIKASLTNRATSDSH